VAQLLPRFRLVDEQTERTQHIARIVLESEHSVSTPIGMAGGDRRQMRGVPVVGRDRLDAAGHQLRAGVAGEAAGRLTRGQEPELRP
jgi:hypothetical protein